MEKKGGKMTFVRRWGGEEICTGNNCVNNCATSKEK